MYHSFILRTFRVRLRVPFHVLFLVIFLQNPLYKLFNVVTSARLVIRSNCVYEKDRRLASNPTTYPSKLFDWPSQNLPNFFSGQKFIDISRHFVKSKLPRKHKIDFSFNTFLQPSTYRNSTIIFNLLVSSITSLQLKLSILYYTIL